MLLRNLLGSSVRVDHADAVPLGFVEREILSPDTNRHTDADGHAIAGAGLDDGAPTWTGADHTNPRSADAGEPPITATKSATSAITPRRRQGPA
jgi:hypothetical protein